MAVSEASMRARLEEVLCADPTRSVSDNRPLAELVDMVCGDLVLCRARLDRLMTSGLHKER